MDPSSPTVAKLQAAGIRPSTQRLVIAEYVLSTTDHPSADRVFEIVHDRLPMVSRATIYNTLNLFSDKGLLKRVTLTEGRVVFDPNTEPHHHIIDESTGDIYDVPWNKLKVSGLDRLEGFEISEHQVVLRGRRS
ncbi:MAG: transcriptional repressor [Myxococcota bacterium]